jgi:nicotinamidase-related amidase
MTQKKALIVIDTINEMLDEKGKLSGKGYFQFSKNNNSIKNINSAIAEARSQKSLVIFVRVAFDSSYDDCPSNSLLFMNAPKFGALQDKTWATEICSGIDYKDTDICLVKKRVSAFYGTQLENLLKENSVTSISLAGCATDLAVNNTARDAHDRDFDITVLSSCCIAANENDHKSSLLLLEKIAKVV